MKVSNVNSAIVIELPDGRYIQLPYQEDVDKGMITFTMTTEARDDLIALANQLL